MFTIIYKVYYFQSTMVSYVIHFNLQANGEAAMGKYTGNSSTVAGDKALYVANNEY